MPPKKKGKKGKGNPLIDGVDTSSMTREQLEAFAHRLKNEMEREREERNFFQLERDKLRSFWVITRNQLDDSRATIRNKNREVEVTHETAEVDIKHAVQQMNHLQYENQARIGEIRAEGMTQLQMAQEDHASQELELLIDKRNLRQQLREKDERTELQVQQLKMHHCELLSKEREKFWNESREMVAIHEKKLQQCFEESTIKHRMEMFEVEERKYTQISRLISAHDEAFDEMIDYYNEITRNNLALISSLKEQMVELRKQSLENERLVVETMAENEMLTEPYKEAQTELAELHKKLEHYNKDRSQLARIKIKHASATKELHSFKWETETLHMKIDTLTKQRDHLRNNFEDAIIEFQQKSSLRNEILERKLNIVREEGEKRDAMLNEALAISGLKIGQLDVGIENILQNKNQKIKDLSFELSRVCKAHNDLLLVYDAKLIQFGIPKEELGFVPYRTCTELKLGAGPAGLVAENL